MTTEQELKEKIKQEFPAFKQRSLLESGTSLLSSLGYTSTKTLQLTPNNFNGFSQIFDTSKNNFNKDKACTDDWEKVEIIFQLSGDDLTDQNFLFSTNQVDNKIIESYLFIAIELKETTYNRGTLAKITREINKLTSMPSMIIFSYSNFITISVIDRRLHKRDTAKDVLEKVTLIKDINLLNVHRAHIEILYELSLDRIKHQNKITNFVDLHEAWRKTLDISELNKKFYRDIANWYFWAIKNVKYPLDKKLSEDSVNNSINVIRLLTRLIFVWFLKEKNLVPDLLFSHEDIKEVINPAADKNKSAYFKAILQNLFFATLNTEMNKDKPHNRRFVKDEDSYLKQRNEYGVKSLYRYSNLFKLSQEDAVKLFDDIPFLNGGLFDCLDKEDDKGKEIYIDGFTRNEKLQPIVPDFLFFGYYQHVDLSEDYGDKKRKDENVRGLIDILKAYKFTVTENTPIEEEVALDPELLGKVFENLLASYNPETQSTARKQTGSFYTPREIVNYMVDESLMIYLKSKLIEGTNSFIKLGDVQTDIFGNATRKGQLKLEEDIAPKPWAEKEEKLEEEIRNLLRYNEKEPAFSPEEKELLISAIENVKILDPACGSGAFPMGVLHKLVHVLHKLDPHNEQWKQKQVQAAELTPDPVVREQQLNLIEESFNSESNYSDYGRKLYLIQRCIYGVDIQPIAVQISKLRFFISLLIDQKDNTGKPNRGVLSLPNLETKFVAANTLIGINKEFGNLFESRLTAMFEQMGRAKNQLFSANTRPKKKKILENISFLKQKIRDHLNENLQLKNVSLKLKIKESLDKIKQFDKELKRIDKEFSKTLRENISNVNKHKSLLNLKSEKERKLIKAIENEEKNLKHYKESLNNFDDLTKNIDEVVSWDFMDQNSSAPFFDLEWMFNITNENGFDIIIGNPPYIQLQKEQGKLADELFSRGYSTFERTGDIYAIFYEHGFRVLKPNGIETFITSSQWMKAGYGKSLRKYFLSKNPLKLISLGPGVFASAIVDTNILITSNSVNKKALCGSIINAKEQIDNLNTLSWYPMQYVSEESWSVLNKENQLIKNKIKARGKPLSKWNIRINFAIKTGYNEAFIIDEIKRDALIKSDPRSIEIIKPILRGREIERFYTEWDNSYIIATFPSLEIDISKYKSIKKYLEGFLPKLKQTGETFITSRGEKEKTRKRTANQWFETQDPIGYHEDFSKEKLIWKRIGSNLRFSYSNKVIYCLDSTCIAVGEKIKYLAALLNSKLCQYQLFESAPRTGMGDLIISVQAFEPLFVYYPTDKEEKLFNSVVDVILILKKLNKNTFYWEEIVDAMVYELYFPEEIKAVDSQILKHLTNLPQLKEEWSDDKKLKAIEKVYKELSDPKHPVIIAMQKMQEIEEVKIIEGKF